MTSIPWGTSNSKSADSSTGFTVAAVKRNARVLVQMVDDCDARWRAGGGEGERCLAQHGGWIAGFQHEVRLFAVLTGFAGLAPHVEPRRPRAADVQQERRRRAVDGLGQGLNRGLLQIRIVGPQRFAVGQQQLRIGFVHFPAQQAGPLQVHPPGAPLQRFAEAVRHHLLELRLERR